MYVHGMYTNVLQTLIVVLALLNRAKTTIKFCVKPWDNYDGIVKKTRADKS